ncbi:MAG: hypothetical protein ACYTGW_05865 [Planctomycetota bacterium]|jgi:hypothetical protein
MKLFRVKSLWLLLGLAACASGPPTDISALAEQSPLPYSVLVTGGAFVAAEAVPGTNGDVLARTFAAVAGSDEGIALDELTKTLKAARVFVAQTTHTADVDLRRKLAAHESEEAMQDVELQAVLAQARREGHDFLLVVAKIQDGDVRPRGINDRWPFTIGAWFLALGAFIPDRTYESTARLHASLRDVHSGRIVFGPTVSEPGPVDLNMFDRCSFGGFLQSILVPPFWTSVNSEKIVNVVRDVSVRRLRIALARKMKSADARDRLANFGPARITVRRSGPAFRISIDSSEAVSFVRMRLDLQPLAGPALRDFEAALLASVRRQGGRFHYTADLHAPLHGRRLQVLVQTVTASIASKTTNLADLK